MTSSPPHIRWLSDSKLRLQTKDGLTVQVWSLNHQPDSSVLSAWAKHFRNHYCNDGVIDQLRSGTSHSRAEYLIQLKFPDAKISPGPSIRSGDFAEILVADYVEFLLGYWVPRCRYEDKAVRNESKKGSDILGFRFQKGSKWSSSDTLLIFESKAQLSGKKTAEILQEAIKHSAKDELRKAESLNALKQRLLETRDANQAGFVSRFQNQEDRPYRSLYGAAAIFASEIFDHKALKACDASSHPNKQHLSLLVITGPKLMSLVHQLYDLAAREA